MYSLEKQYIDVNRLVSGSFLLTSMPAFFTTCGKVREYTDTSLLEITHCAEMVLRCAEVHGKEKIHNGVYGELAHLVLYIREETLILDPYPCNVTIKSHFWYQNP